MLLDVADVPRGRKCGCICPSCKTPLIARQGTQKEWHFAHASRSVYSETKSECEFSFYVAARLMARQLIGDSLSINLPEYNDQIDEYLSDYGQWVSVPFNVTKQQRLTLTEVEVEKSFTSIPVDVYGKVNGFSFVIYFTHPGREAPQELYSPSTSKCGVISVSLLGLSRLFRGERGASNSYLGLLSEYLANDIESKKWIYHPRYRSCEEEARKVLQQKKLLLKQTHSVRQKMKKHSSVSAVAYDNSISVTPIERPPKRLANFECAMCHSTWQGLDPSGSVCPKCDTHLYRTVKEYLDKT